MRVDWQNETGVNEVSEMEVCQTAKWREQRWMTHIVITQVDELQLSKAKVEVQEVGNRQVCEGGCSQAH